MNHIQYQHVAEVRRIQTIPQVELAIAVHHKQEATVRDLQYIQIQEARDAGLVE